jgi:hypothetical protein
LVSSDSAAFRRFDCKFVRGVRSRSHRQRSPAAEEVRRSAVSRGAKGGWKCTRGLRASSESVSGWAPAAGGRHDGVHAGALRNRRSLERAPSGPGGRNIGCESFPRVAWTGLFGRPFGDGELGFVLLVFHAGMGLPADGLRPVRRCMGRIPIAVTGDAQSSKPKSPWWLSGIGNATCCLALLIPRTLKIFPLGKVKPRCPRASAQSPLPPEGGHGRCMDSRWGLIVHRNCGALRTFGKAVSDME